MEVQLAEYLLFCLPERKTPNVRNPKTAHCPVSKYFSLSLVVHMWQKKKKIEERERERTNKDTRKVSAELQRCD